MDLQAFRALPTEVRSLPAAAEEQVRLRGPAAAKFGEYASRMYPAVVRAGLVAELAEDIAGGPLDGNGTLLTSDELRHTPFATAYEVIEVPTHAPEPEPEASVEFVVAAADGPMVLSAVPLPARFP
ncbi:hypothetical protein [Streptomyces sp. NPDC059072]|uniref:hypothetical protein n=1 Tax=Streptomyces sp. NPDC059072 TaxID=3346715 RepID=UPI0036C42FC2